MTKKNSSKKTDFVRFACSAASSCFAISAAQLVNMPIINIGSQKYVYEKTYRQIVGHIYESEGLGGFYKEFFNNTSRRCLAGVLPLVVTDFVGKEYLLNPSQTTALATILETTISIARDEAGEKYRMSRSVDQKGHLQNKMKANGFIAVRNSLFAGSIFGSQDLVKKLSSKVDDDFFENKDFNRDQFEKAASFAVKTMLVLGTTPADRVATKLSAGDSLKEVLIKFQERPQDLFKGGVTRTAFGMISSLAISKGIQLGGEFYDKMFVGKVREF
jgi:hypothetical protein